MCPLDRMGEPVCAGFPQWDKAQRQRVGSNHQLGRWKFFSKVEIAPAALAFARHLRDLGPRGETPSDHQLRRWKFPGKARIALGTCSTPVGFEPTRGDPVGLAGRRLSHSAKVSYTSVLGNNTCIVAH